MIGALADTGDAAVTSLAGADRHRQRRDDRTRRGRIAMRGDDVVEDRSEGIVDAEVEVVVLAAVEEGLFAGGADDVDLDGQVVLVTHAVGVVGAVPEDRRMRRRRHHRTEGVHDLVGLDRLALVPQTPAAIVDA